MRWNEVRKFSQRGGRKSRDDKGAELDDILVNTMRVMPREE